LRGVPALARNCQADWFAPRLPGPPRDHPLITQEELSKSHTEKLKLSFLLFDEIEKASDALWQLLLACWIRPRSLSVTTVA